MVLIGSDFHPSWQQVSWLNQETGETGDVKLVHEPGAAEKFFRQFPAGSRMGMGATGNCQWFVELMTSLGHEVLVGPAGGGADHVAGTRTEDGRCLAVSTRKTGGELFGADSAGVQFGRTSAVGIDQQAGKFVFADAVGGSGARSSAVRSGISE
jgi:hypothetical protein